MKRCYKADDDPVLRAFDEEQALFLETHSILGSTVKKFVPSVSYRALQRIYAAVYADQVGLETSEHDGELYCDPKECRAWLKTDQARFLMYPRLRH